MIDGTLETISSVTRLTFERHGNQVFNTTFGSMSPYCFGMTKSLLYGKLQAIKEHCYVMRRMIE